jgi:TctA family transporter
LLLFPSLSLKVSILDTVENLLAVVGLTRTPISDHYVYGVTNGIAIQGEQWPITIFLVIVSCLFLPILALNIQYRAAHEIVKFKYQVIRFVLTGIVGKSRFQITIFMAIYLCFSFVHFLLPVFWRDDIRHG